MHMDISLLACCSEHRDCFSWQLATGGGNVFHKTSKKSEDFERTVGQKLFFEELKAAVLRKERMGRQC